MLLFLDTKYNRYIVNINKTLNIQILVTLTLVKPHPTAVKSCASPIEAPLRAIGLLRLSIARVVANFKIPISFLIVFGSHSG